jgi:hypothetical protein
MILKDAPGRGIRTIEPALAHRYYGASGGSHRLARCPNTAHFKKGWAYGVIWLNNSGLLGANKQGSCGLYAVSKPCAAVR